jgi:hypothetical protein
MATKSFKDPWKNVSGELSVTVTAILGRTQKPPYDYGNGQFSSDKESLVLNVAAGSKGVAGFTVAIKYDLIFPGSDFKILDRKHGKVDTSVFADYTCDSKGLMAFTAQPYYPSENRRCPFGVSCAADFNGNNAQFPLSGFGAIQITLNAPSQSVGNQGISWGPISVYSSGEAQGDNFRRMKRYTSKFHITGVVATMPTVPSDLLERKIYFLRHEGQRKLVAGKTEDEQQNNRIGNWVSDLQRRADAKDLWEVVSKGKVIVQVEGWASNTELGIVNDGVSGDRAAEIAARVKTKVGSLAQTNYRGRGIHPEALKGPNSSYRYAHIRISEKEAVEAIRRLREERTLGGASR